jgi:two-component system sensor histidine kinase KdpD
VLIVRDTGALRLAAATPPGVRLDAIDLAAAQWAFDRGLAAGASTETLAAGTWQFHALKTSLGVLAVVGIADPDGGNPLPADRTVLFTTLLGQAALAWERIRLENDARSVADLRNRDALRATLLASIGHDLRNPLAAVIGAVDSLHRDGVAGEAMQLLRRETRRLARFFADLIDMTRVEANALAPRVQPVDLTDAAQAALADLEAELQQHRIRVAVPPDLPLVETDPRLLHHMLINLLSNAASYTPPGTTIHVVARLEPATGLILSIEDEGPGLPANLEGRIFERFERGDVSDRSGGTGLGLAIVRGFGNALGLGTAAANRPGGGAIFTLTFPPSLLSPVAEAAPA